MTDLSSLGLEPNGKTRTFGPLTFLRQRLQAKGSIPSGATWHVVLQLSSRMSVQLLVIRFDA